MSKEWISINTEIKTSQSNSRTYLEKTLPSVVKYMPELERIGKAIAKTVKPQHFTQFLQSPASLTTVS